MVYSYIHGKAPSFVEDLGRDYDKNRDNHAFTQTRASEGYQLTHRRWQIASSPGHNPDMPERGMPTT